MYSAARGLLIGAVVLLWQVTLLSPTYAVIHEWTNAVDGTFSTGGNWTPVGPPGVGDTALFNEASPAYTVSFTSSPTSDALDFDAGDVTFRSFGVDQTYNITTGGADVSIQNGTLTLGVSGDPLDLNIGDALTVNNTAFLNVEFGSDLTADGLVSVGNGGGGDGTIIVDNSSISLGDSTSDQVRLGLSGLTGTLTLQNESTGVILGDTEFALSGSSNSKGFLNVYSGSTLTTGDLEVVNSSTGSNREGKITVDGTQGGTDSELTMSGASTITVGRATQATISEVEITNSGIFNSGTGAAIFQNGAVLDIGSGGTFVSNGPLTIDGATLDLASTGTFTNGVGSSLLAQNNAQLNFYGDQNIDNGVTWTLQTGTDYTTDSSGDDLFVGNVTNGTLIVENSGTTVDLSLGGDVYIGFNGATGTMTVRDDATANFDIVNVADDSDPGTTGILNIEDGADVTANHIEVASFFAGPTTSGTINIGGTTGFASLTINGAGTIKVGDTSALDGPGTINITNFRGSLIGGTGLTTIENSGLIEINDGTFQAKGDVLVSGGELRELNNGNFDLESGLTLTANGLGQVNFDSAYDIDDDTTFLIQGGADFSVTSSLDIGFGNGESGTLIVEGVGSTVTVTSTTSVGELGGSGNLTLRGGATASFSTLAIVDIPSAQPTTGTVLVELGANVTSSSLFVNDEGGNGTAGALTITGSGSSWAATTLVLGDDLSGTATIEVLDGGALTTTSTATFQDTGVMTIDGGTVAFGAHSASGGQIDFVSGSLSSGSDWTIESGGILGHLVTLTPGKHLATTGTFDDLDLETGGTLVLDGGSLDVYRINDNGGSFQFLSGTLSLRDFNAFDIDSSSIFGSAYTLGTNQHVILASRGNVSAGALLTLDGGTINSTSQFFNSGTTVVGAGSQLSVDTLDNFSTGRLVIGPNSSVQLNTTSVEANVGEIQLAGGSATFEFAGTNYTNLGLIRGDGTFSGNLTNDAAGEIRTSFGERIRVTGTNGANAGQLNLQGGTLEFDNPLTNGATGDILGRGTLDVGGSGLVNEGDLVLSNGQTDIFGDVANQTTGRVIVSGNADVTFWDDVSDSGTLFNVSTGSSATFFGTAGFGVSGGGDVFFEADITPGSSPGLETFGGNVHLGVLANLEIEIEGTSKGSQYDSLDISGLADLGGSLEISFLNGFLPSAGDTFEIITASSVSDTFDALVLPSLPGDLLWFVNYDATSVNLVSTYAGDFDEDGDVDDDDLIAWEGGFGSAPAVHMTGDANADVLAGGFDFLVWQRQFGMVGGAPAVAAVVPEPCGITLSILGGLLLVGWRQRG